MKNYSIPAKNREELLKKFGSLENGALVSISLSNMNVLLKKFDPMTFIDSI